jgi:hypothetical protein
MPVRNPLVISVGTLYLVAAIFLGLFATSATIGWQMASSAYSAYLLCDADGCVHTVMDIQDSGEKVVFAYKMHGSRIVLIGAIRLRNDGPPEWLDDPEWLSEFIWVMNRLKAT